jgi:putative phosphoesterase
MLGILSDTHGRTDAAAAAVSLLLNHGATQLIHCGDVGGVDVLNTLAGHAATFVFGNNDVNHFELARYAGDIGVVCGFESVQLQLAGGKVGLLTHGDDSRLISRTLREQQVDYLFVGHTHRKQDERQGRVRIINPGALYRASAKTVALLDPASDQLRFLTVPI